MTGMRCADVSWDSTSFVERAIPELHAGLLVWDPKDCRDHGHVLAAEVTCGEDGHYCGYCGGFSKHEMWVCECGKVDLCDHHVMFSGDA